MQEFMFGALTGAVLFNVFINIWILDTIKNLLKEIRREK